MVMTWDRAARQDRLARMDPENHMARRMAQIETSRITGKVIPCETQAITPSGVLDYIFSGKAVLTVKSLKTKKHITYKVKQKVVKIKDLNGKKTGERREDLFFVNVMTGNDNNTFTYLGVVARAKGIVKTTTKSSFKDSDPATKVIQWVINNPMHTDLRVFHDNSCGRCGRRLTVPTSVKTGIGPICEGKIREEKRAKLKDGG